MKYLNQIINCDCFDLFKKIPDNSVDCIITDPPYYIKNANASLKHCHTYVAKIKFKQMNVGSGNDAKIFYESTFLNELLRIVKTANIGIFCSKNSIPLLLNFAEDKALFWNIAVVGKTSVLPTASLWVQSLDYFIHIYSNGKNTTSLSTTMRKNYLIKNHTIESGVGHPCPKKLNITRYFLKIISKEQDIIFDPFIGSGTTALACIEEGRRYIGCEIDKDYYDIAQKRIIDATRQGRLNFAI